MGLYIGMDEAGYGPNLGPLVVTVTVWEVPGRWPQRFDFWNRLADCLTATLEAGDTRLHIADSKVVYNPSRGIRMLERSVLAGLMLCDCTPNGFRDLWQQIAAPSHTDAATEPWFDGADILLPIAMHDPAITEPAARWRECCEQHGVRLRAVRSEIVLTERFNRLTAEMGSKGSALSRLSMRLLRSVWDPDSSTPTFIVADKHGGRNRYDGLLDEVLDGQMIFRQNESEAYSCYRVNNSEIQFRARAEEYFPVAFASMVSKYVREVAMELFNRFWRVHLPELKPTKGYHTDAMRFREEIAAVQAALGIEDQILWRAR